MKALGHQRRLSDVLRMSALPLIADLSLRCRERSKRANNRHMQRSKPRAYSITPSGSPVKPISLDYRSPRIGFVNSRR
jgi:hypothetical protein